MHFDTFKGAVNGMVFIVTGESIEKVRERVDSIIDGIERQGKYDFQLDVRKTAEGRWKGTLVLYFHTAVYPSHYPPKNPG